MGIIYHNIMQYNIILYEPLVYMMSTVFLIALSCRYRHMGVIGAVMVIRQLAESSAAFDMNRTVASQQNSTSIGLTPARRRKVAQLLFCTDLH